MCDKAWTKWLCSPVLCLERCSPAQRTAQSNGYEPQGGRPHKTISEHNQPSHPQGGYEPQAGNQASSSSDQMLDGDQSHVDSPSVTSFYRNEQGSQAFYSGGSWAPVAAQQQEKPWRATEREEDFELAAELIPQQDDERLQQKEHHEVQKGGDEHIPEEEVDRKARAEQPWPQEAEKADVDNFFEPVD